MTRTKKAATPTEDLGQSTLNGEVLVVNRDPDVRLILHKALFVGNVCSTSVTTEDEALACLRKGGYVAAVVVVESPEAIDTLQSIRAAFGDIPLLAFSRAATPSLVRDVMRTGVDDFVFGTFHAKSLLRSLQELIKDRIAGGASARDSASKAAAPARAPAASGSKEKAVSIICRNDKMLRVLDIAAKISSTDSTVLIQGESGTGKELIASWIHHHSKRREAPFVEVNCGALPENLLESQLFGHEKGSFTGAVHRQIGLFEVSDGGTIFLDEIGEMGLDMQVKLLRVLQSREFRRIGGSQVVKVDVRVIAATNRDLKEEVEAGRFRKDLYYRLNVISLELPPLRERREEIPELVKSFCSRLAEEKGMPRKEFSPEAVESLRKYSWEGNIRELENAVERLILLSSKDTVETSDVEEHLDGQKRGMGESPYSPDMSLDEVKRLHVAKVLRENGGNKMRSARILKINVKTLYNLIKSLDIKP